MDSGQWPAGGENENSMTPANPIDPQAPGTPTPTSPPPAKLEPTESATPAPSPLTPEEQMALFEQELKETDWGHQPC
jgi:hypothetical protein